MEKLNRYTSWLAIAIVMVIGMIPFLIGILFQIIKGSFNYGKELADVAASWINNYYDK